MIVTLALSAAVSAALGTLVLLWAWPRDGATGSRPLVAALGTGLGAGLSSLLLFAWLILVGPTRAFPLVEVALVVLLAFATYRWRFAPGLGAGRAWLAGPARLLTPVFFLALAAAAAAFVAMLRQEPHGGWDAWMNWDMRARMFFRGGEGWRAAFSAAIPWSHPDYPVLVPALVARTWFYAGTETVLGPHLVAATFTFGTVALLVSALAVLRSRTQGLLAGLLLLATPFFIGHGTSLYADVPLGFFVLATLVCLAIDGRSGEGTGRFAVLAGVAAGLAMWTKNEGLLFTLALGAGLLLAHRRRLLQFAAAVLPLFLLVVGFKIAFAPPNDLLSTLSVQGTLARLTDGERYSLVAREYARHIAGFGRNALGGAVWPLAACLVGLGVGRAKLGRPWVRAATAGLVLLLAGHFMVFVSMAHELARLLNSSLDRLLLQLWPGALFLFFMTLRTLEEVGFRVLASAPAEARGPSAGTGPWPAERRLGAIHPDQDGLMSEYDASLMSPSSTKSRVRTTAGAVWLVWALTLASLLAAIALDGRNIPFEEDWLMVAPMTGHEPDLPRWLWSQNSEHRLPLPRLVNLALLRTTGDFRSTMVFDTLALGAVAAAMILVARRLRRGRTSLADAFFPLLLLQLGNWDNLVWGWQIQFVLPTVLACVLLLVIVARPNLETRGIAAVAALALIGLPLSGANGLVFTPILAGWLAYGAWMRRHDPGLDRWAAVRIPAGAAVVALLLCAVYFVGYQASPWNEASPGLGATLATAGKFVALSLGPAAGRQWLLFGLAGSALLLVAVWLLIVARGWKGERLRVFGLLAFLAAAAALALAVGWGRAGRTAVTGDMPTRYVLLAAPGLCAAYFVALLYGRGRWTRRLPAAMAVLAALLFPLNTRAGFQRRAWFGAGFAPFERDMGEGASAALLAARHHKFMLHWDEALMVTSLRQLHAAGVGRFGTWDPDGPPGPPAR